MRSVIDWWNTPTENLKTKGENLVSLLFLVLPLGLTITLPLIYLLGLVSWSHWFVIIPLVLFLMFPICAIFMVTGRSILMKGTSVRKLAADDPLTKKYIAATTAVAAENQVVNSALVKVCEDLEDSTTVYVVYECIGTNAQATEFVVELDKKKLNVRGQRFVQKPQNDE